MAEGLRLTGLAPARMMAAGLMSIWATGAWAEVGFDKSIWQTPMGYDEENPRRQEMLPGALASLTNGTPAAEVKASLGSPEAQFDTEWVYYLGKSKEQDSKVLIVFFNGDGLLVSAREFQGAAYAPPDGAHMTR